ncbi:hypothetical protein BGX27_000609 [Mortierella sp. AM989]|nr:hypothetical protein BGX27_000609 [Mortierella sp. AM989]
MESILEQPLATTKQLDQTTLHLLPCGIHHDGKANIPGFFFLVDGQYPPVANSKESHTNSNTETLVIADENLNMSTIKTITSTTTTTISETSETTSIFVPPETSFRGRTLKGAVVPIPLGYMGTLYKSYDARESGNIGKSGRGGDRHGADMDMDEDQEYEEMLKGMQEERKSLRTEAQFKNFTMWGHDEQPSLRTEKVIRAMQWFDIANVLHEPLC